MFDCLLLDCYVKFIIYKFILQTPEVTPMRGFKLFLTLNCKFIDLKYT